MLQVRVIAISVESLEYQPTSASAQEAVHASERRSNDTRKHQFAVHHEFIANKTCSSTGMYAYFTLLLSAVCREEN
jgi:hypothetical protein